MKYYMSVPISPEQYAAAKELIQTVLEAERKTKYHGRIADQVLLLTDEALEHAFMLPLELIKSGFLTRKTAQIALSTAKSGVGTVIRRILRDLDDDELVTIVRFLDSLLSEQHNHE